MFSLQPNFSGVPPLESVEALLSLFVSHSQKEAKTSEPCTGKFHSDGNTAMEASFLNRVIRWRGLSWRLARGTLRWCFAIRVWRSRFQLLTLVAKRPKSEELLLQAGSKLLHAQDSTLYKSITMRVNYLSLDRPDLSFAAGSLARGMKSPTTKNLGSHSRGRPVGDRV